MSNLEEIIFSIIVHGGNARAKAYDALKVAQNSHFKDAEVLMIEAEKEIAKTHRLQTDIIRKEASGERVNISVLFAHAQDHLMTAMAEKSLIENMIDLYKRIDILEKEG